MSSTIRITSEQNYRDCSIRDIMAKLNAAKDILFSIDINVYCEYREEEESKIDLQINVDAIIALLKAEWGRLYETLLEIYSPPRDTDSIEEEIEEMQERLKELVSWKEEIDREIAHDND